MTFPLLSIACICIAYIYNYFPVDFHPWTVTFVFGRRYGHYFFIYSPSEKSNGSGYVSLLYILYVDYWLNHVNSINAIITSLIWYTFETGLLTWLVSKFIIIILIDRYILILPSVPERFLPCFVYVFLRHWVSNSLNKYIRRIVGDISKLPHFPGYPLRHH